MKFIIVRCSFLLLVNEGRKMNMSVVIYQSLHGRSELVK